MINEKPNYGFTKLTAEDISYRRPKPKVIQHYVLGMTIGEGSFGKVREGVHLRTKRRVAIKIIKTRKLRRFGESGSVENEIAVQQMLRHPNVVELLEQFSLEEKEKRYIVQEYVDGGTLKSLLDSANHHRLSMRQAQALFSHLITGLEYLHTMGIVHKDIKPDNLLVSTQGDLKITDFGVAEQLSHKNNDLVVRTSGSPIFQPPEVSRGAEQFHGFQLDIWAAGITLYMMVVGKFPFEGNSIYEILEKIGCGSYEIPSCLDPACADLISGILVAPERRLTLQQIKTHSWFSQSYADETDVIVPIRHLPSLFGTSPVPLIPEAEVADDTSSREAPKSGRDCCILL